MRKEGTRNVVKGFLGVTLSLSLAACLVPTIGVLSDSAKAIAEDDETNQNIEALALDAESDAITDGFAIETFEAVPEDEAYEDKAYEAEADFDAEELLLEADEEVFSLASEGEMQASEATENEGRQTDLKENSWRYVEGERINSDGETSLYSLQANESNHWTRSGNTWSTTRGGKQMTVTNARAFGVDVSEHQYSIDWNKAKADGVQFAIIRVGYGDNYSDQDDKYFSQNIDGVRKAGIPFGVYIYSYAKCAGTNGEKEATAISEADHMLRKLNEKKIKPSELMFPVYLDMEDNSTVTAGSQGLADIASAFCNRISSAGYTPGIYANKTWFTNYLTKPVFSRWSKWVAQYPNEGSLNAKSSYTGTHDMWQCMSSGKVNGINTSADINFDYRFYSGTNVANPTLPTTGESKYSAVYDNDYYLANNPDVRKAFNGDRAATLNHFIAYGMKEGRQAKETFNVGSYYNKHVDLRSAFGANLPMFYQHYMDYGQKEGREATGCNSLQGYVTTYDGKSYSAVYDGSTYYNNYADLRAAFRTNKGAVTVFDDNAMMHHFVFYGMKEGRTASNNFNVESYYNKYPDLRAALGADTKQLTMHYVNYGQKEKRQTTGCNAIEGAITWHSGRNYADVYNPAHYVATYDDLRAAFSTRIGNYTLLNDGALINHLVDYGMKEGRITSPDFNVQTYKNNYEDLRAAFGEDLKSYYVHYVDYGKKEGRQAV